MIRRNPSVPVHWMDGNKCPVNFNAPRDWWVRQIWLWQKSYIKHNKVCTCKNLAKCDVTSDPLCHPMVGFSSRSTFAPLVLPDGLVSDHWGLHDVLLTIMSNSSEQNLRQTCVRLDKLIVLFLKNTFLAFNRRVVSSLCAALTLIWWFVFKESFFTKMMLLVLLNTLKVILSFPLPRLHF